MSARSPNSPLGLSMARRVVAPVSRNSKGKSRRLPKGRGSGTDHALARALWADYTATTTCTAAASGTAGEKQKKKPKKAAKKRPARDLPELPPPLPPSYAEAAESSADDLEVVVPEVSSKRQRVAGSKACLSEFEVFYAAMDPLHKWTLRTGKVVEDALYDAITTAAVESERLKMWIIDASDLAVPVVFSKEEIAELLEGRTDGVHGVEDVWDRYSAITTSKELRSALFGEIPKQGIKEEWVYGVMRQLLALYENASAPLKSAQLESWYEVNLWGPLIDALLLRAVPDVVVLRKESASHAAVVSLNAARTTTGPGSYVRTGARSDLVIRGVGVDWPLEYGAGETGGRFAGIRATKYIVDGMKLRATMRGMLSRLVGEGKAGKEVAVVGVLCSGLRLTLLEMWAPVGRYMGVIRTVGPVGVPDDVRKLPRIGALLAALWVMKETVEGCVRIMDEC
ncbi:hypothetical protein DFP73DRAFT_108580 [Morchella snyderi]|nr:hypothetical protein DFP73DRAFT_108580 [Morchella snyderi]